MKSIALYCNWGAHIDMDGRCWLPSVHARYIQGLRAIGYEQITLLTRTSKLKSEGMDFCVEVDGFEILRLPWFDSYQGAIRYVHMLVKGFVAVRKINPDKLYIRTYEPLGWLAALLNMRRGRRKDVVMHFISDPKSAIFSNAKDRSIVKWLRYLFFLPEYMLTVVAASIFRATSNGPVPMSRAPKFLRRKMKEVIESALLESDVARQNEVRRDREGSHVTVLYVGYVRASKGFPDLVDAMALAHDQGLINFNLIVVGDGSYREEAELRVVRSGLVDKVTFVGYVPFSNRLFEYYKSADVFINPSPSETGPRVLLEAKVFGCYLISTNVGYARRIIENESQGAIVGVHEPEKIAEALKAYVEYKHLSRASNLKLMSQYSHSITVESFFKVVLDEA